jgi:hypothetical protein
MAGNYPEESIKQIIHAWVIETTQCYSETPIKRYAAAIIPLLWQRISGLRRFGLSPGLGTSRWFPVIAISGARSAGELSLTYCRESLQPVGSIDVAVQILLYLCDYLMQDILMCF